MCASGAQSCKLTNIFRAIRSRNSKIQRQRFFWPCVRTETGDRIAEGAECTKLNSRTSRDREASAKEPTSLLSIDRVSANSAQPASQPVSQRATIPERVRHHSPFLTIKTFVLLIKVGICRHIHRQSYVTHGIISNLRTKYTAQFISPSLAPIGPASHSFDLLRLHHPHLDIDHKQNQVSAQDIVRHSASNIFERQLIASEYHPADSE